MNVKLDMSETGALLAIKTGKLTEIRARHLSNPETSLDHYLQSQVKISLKASQYHVIKTCGELELSLKAFDNRCRRVGSFTPLPLYTQCPRCRKVCGTRDGLDSGKKKKSLTPASNQTLITSLQPSRYSSVRLHTQTYVSPTPCRNRHQWARAY